MVHPRRKQLVYVLSPLPSNDHNIKLIQNDLFTFLWNGKKDKIKHSEMINDYEDGGLKMLNLKSFSRSLKFTWIQKYLNDESHEKWKVFIEYYLKQLREKLIFSCNLRKDDISHIKKFGLRSILSNPMVLKKMILKIN